MEKKVKFQKIILLSKTPSNFLSYIIDNLKFTTFNAEVYNKFKEECYKPYYDLQSLIEIKPGLNVIHLYCGTGELTQKLSQYLPDSNILGIDSSSEMLKLAREFANSYVHFEKAGIQTVAEQYDLIFSNAAQARSS